MSEEERKSWLSDLFNSSKLSAVKPSVMCMKKKFALEKLKKAITFLEEGNTDIKMENLGIACKLLLERYSTFSGTDVRGLSAKFLKGFNDVRHESVIFEKSKPPKA